MLSFHLCLCMAIFLFRQVRTSKVLYAFLISRMHIACLAHLIPPYLVTLVTQNCKLRSVSLSPSFFLPPRLNIVLSTLFSDALNLCESRGFHGGENFLYFPQRKKLIVYPCKTTGKIIFYSLRPLSNIK
jgi:hypothetical protein